MPAIDMSGNDTLYGGEGEQSLSGGEGDDLIEGGKGSDTLSGGEGEDTFVILQGDGPLTRPDVIVDWSADDLMRFNTGPGPYQETTAPDAGRTYANSLIAAGARFVAVQTPQGVIVYVDTAVNGGAAEDAILLSGRTLDDISARNVGAAEVLPTAPPAPPEPTATPTPTPTPTPGVADTLHGTAGPDTLNGGGGDDVIFNTPGDDLLDGGPGIDTLDLSEAPERVNFTLGASQAPSGQLGADSLAGFERVVGTRFSDILGSVVDATLSGGAGADTIFGSTAGTALVGDDGDDRLYGDGFIMLGGEGADTLLGDDGGALLGGGPGLDWLRGGSGPAADTLNGGDGDDTLEAAGGAEVMVGGAGNDLFLIPVSQSGGYVIQEWDVATDRLRFDDGTQVVTYAETTVASLDAALAAANARIGSGEVNFLAVQVGGDVGDVYVFADRYRGDTVAATVRLEGRTLADIGPGNLGGIAVPEPTAPAPPLRTQFVVQGTVFGDMDALRLQDLLVGASVGASDNYFSITRPDDHLTLMGSGFTYRQDQNFVYEIRGGVITSLGLRTPTFGADLTSTGSAAAPLGQAVLAGQNETALSGLLDGNDKLRGDSPRIVLRGYAGDDVLYAGPGASTVYGGTGDDQIFATLPSSTAVGPNYLRGDEGNDYIAGSVGFDDINGNMGADTGAGGAGDDWVVGGKDNDLLFGDGGNDLVYGNLGGDTCYGGAGADTVRGGQDDDLVEGGAGADYISGDRGNDTMTGGADADVFHSFGEAGVDRVTDFSVAAGDRVQLDPGTSYSVAQVGADTVVTMTGGGQLILVGVQMSTLPAGWIFGA